MPSWSSDETSVADLRVRAFCQRWLLGMREIGVADEHMACALGAGVKAIRSAQAGKGWSTRSALPRVFGRMGNELRTMGAADVVAWSAAVKAGERKSAARATSGVAPGGDSGFAPLGEVSAELSAEGRHSRFVEWLDAMQAAGVADATVASALGFNVSTIRVARRKAWRGGGRLARVWRVFGDEVAAMLPEDISEWALGVRAGWMRSAKARLADMESGSARGASAERGKGRRGMVAGRSPAAARVMGLLARRLRRSRLGRGLARLGRGLPRAALTLRPRQMRRAPLGAWMRRMRMMGARALMSPRMLSARSAPRLAGTWMR